MYTKEINSKSLANKRRLSDICASLRCNVSVAQEIFRQWYLEPYGLNALDDTEARTFCSPFIQSLPAQEDHCSSSESDTDLTSAQDACERPRKRLHLRDDSFTSPITASTVSTSPSGLSSSSRGTADRFQGTPVQHGRANKHDSARDGTSGNLSSKRNSGEYCLLIMISCFPMSGRVHSVELGPDGDQQQISATYPENIQFLDTQVKSSPIAQPSKLSRRKYQLHVIMIYLS